MVCESGIHLWTARFFKSGALAFWFCQDCGETDREVEHFEEQLEDLSGFPDDFPAVCFSGEKPPSPAGQWLLSDGSILRQGEPVSMNFRGNPIPGIPDSFQYTLTVKETDGKRKYIPGLERYSTSENCFILTRYRVENNRLVKYRIHCCQYPEDRSVRIDQPNGNTILSGLKPVSD